MNKKSTLGFITPIIFATMSLAILTMANSTAFAQNMTTTTQEQDVSQQSLSLNQTANASQIKQHLTEAITALDNGNNTKAAEQIELADEQLETLAGTNSDEDSVDNEDEEQGGDEEESETEAKSEGQD